MKILPDTSVLVAACLIEPRTNGCRRPCRVEVAADIRAILISPEPFRTPDGEPSLNYLCAGYKAFFNHIDKPMRTMANLLRQGRYADEIMPLYAAEDKARFAAVGGQIQ